MQGISQGTVPDETGKEGTRWRRTLNVLSKRLNYSPEATESVMGLKHESDIISFAFYLGHLAAVWSLDWWERWKAAKADETISVVPLRGPETLVHGPDESKGCVVR